MEQNEARREKIIEAIEGLQPGEEIVGTYRADGPFPVEGQWSVARWEGDAAPVYVVSDGHPEPAPGAGLHAGQSETGHYLAAAGHVFALGSFVELA